MPPQPSGGIHGVAGHSIEIPATGDARWERRVGSFGPAGRAGAGTFTLTSDERRRVVEWKGLLRGMGSGEYFDHGGTPDWVWAVAFRELPGKR